MNEIDPATPGLIVNIAESILDGKIGITEGARLLSTLRIKLNLEDDEDLLVAAGVDSELDFPIGEFCQHWEPEALARKDAERKATEGHYRERFFAACGRLIERFG